VSAQDGASEAIDNDLIARMAAYTLVLRDLIERYGNHMHDCPSRSGYPCTCGWWEADI
jgi:hypothetical protein